MKLFPKSFSVNFLSCFVFGRKATRAEMDAMLDDENTRPRSEPTPRRRRNIKVSLSKLESLIDRESIDLCVKNSLEGVEFVWNKVTVFKGEFKDVRKKYIVDTDNSVPSGKFGESRTCLKLDNGNVFLCKTVHKSRLKTINDLKSIRTEVRIMKRLKGCPYASQLRSCFEDSQDVHLIIEPCKEHMTLANRMKSGQNLSDREAAMAVRSVACVLATCHKDGIVLRNVELENIHCSNGGSSTSFQVVDFGSSVALNPKGKPLPKHPGSQCYLPPEAEAGRDYGCSADVWSLGIVLRSLLTEVSPESFYGHGGPLDSVEDLWNVSLGAVDLLERLLCLEGEKRISAVEILCHPWILDKAAV